MATGMQVANYVIQRYNETKENKDYRPLTNLKLQKILYFIQGWTVSGVGAGDALIDDTFEKWKFGPVIREVYREFKSEGANELLNPMTIATINNNRLEFDLPMLDNSDFDRIDDLNILIDNLLRRSATELVNETHREVPWSKQKDAIESGAQNLEYSISEIRDVFTNDSTAQEFIEIQ